MDKMKKISMLVALILISVYAFSQKATDDFTGKYKTEDGVIITITKTKGTFIGLDPEKKQALYNIRFEENEWKGTVTNNKTNQTGKCEILLEGNKLKIVAHKAFLTKTFYWVKI
jgi:uncharacterized protein (DUF2147 family)